MSRSEPSIGLAETSLDGSDAAVAQAATLGRTLVVVPHPDDETLGCGGLLALLARAGMPLLIVLVSDGAASHPNSSSHRPPRLQALRAAELLSALTTLGLASPRLWAMGLPDGKVPAPDQPGFGTCVDRFVRKVNEFQPETILLPWRHDDHPDHRASHGIASAACDRAAPQSRRLEYLVWAPEQRRPDDDPKAVAWPIAIDSVVDRKCRALEAHRSQLGHVVLDDPGGFVLPAGLVARCSLPTETYYDTTAWSAR